MGDVESLLLIIKTHPSALAVARVLGLRVGPAEDGEGGGVGHGDEAKDAEESVRVFPETGAGHAAEMEEGLRFVSIYNTKIGPSGGRRHLPGRCRQAECRQSCPPKQQTCPGGPHLPKQ